MGKRSNFERRPRDFYPTPRAALEPLLPHLRAGTRFIEPCAGDGRLAGFLEEAGHVCLRQYDTEPRGEKVLAGDARVQRYEHRVSADCFITNPPWDRDVLHPIIENLLSQQTVWLLLDADWAHTRQAAPYLKKCHSIVSVGRVKWLEGSNHTGKDNCCWYQFWWDANRIQFYGRTP